MTLIRTTLRHQEQQTTEDLRPRKDRYEACTLDGSVIHYRDTAQEMADAVARHISRGVKPHIAYTYDTAPGVAYPYTTWENTSMGYVGTSWATFDQVCIAIGARI